MTNTSNPPPPALQVINGATQIHLGLKTALGIAISTVTCFAAISAFFYSEMKEDLGILRGQISAKDTTIAAMAARVKTLENGADQQVAVTEYTPGTDNSALTTGINLPPVGWTSANNGTDVFPIPWASIPSLDPTTPVSMTPPSIYCQAPPTIMPDGTDNSANICLILPDPATAIDRIDATSNPTPLIEDLRSILEQSGMSFGQN